MTQRLPCQQSAGRGSKYIASVKRVRAAFRYSQLYGVLGWNECEHAVVWAHEEPSFGLQCNCTALRAHTRIDNDNVNGSGWIELPVSANRECGCENIAVRNVVPCIIYKRRVRDRCDHALHCSNVSVLCAEVGEQCCSLHAPAGTAPSTLAITLSAMSRSACAAGESTADSEVGLPASPDSRTRGSSGISPRKGTCM